MTTDQPSSKIIEQCKLSAAKAAVFDHIKATSCVIGIGSGSTMRYVLESIKHIHFGPEHRVLCIPTSYQSKQLIHDYGLSVTDLDANPVIDVTIDGADEVDQSLVAIKGGGACLAQEKVVAAAAKKFIIVADYRKDSKQLGDNWTKGIPIEVLPMACNRVRMGISDEFGVSLDCLNVRQGKEKAGPVVTDNGNFVIDWKFANQERSAADWLSISSKLKLMPGVVEVGLFVKMADAVYFGQPDGTVFKKERPTNGANLPG